MNESTVAQSLVVVNNGEARTTSLVIAEGTEVDHASVIKLVRTYQSDLEEFGLLDFKSESTAGRPTEYAMLNEQQSTLLMTYMRNSEIVRTFKKRLVKAFYELAHRAKDPIAMLNDPATLKQLLLANLQTIEEQKNLISDLAPKAGIAERIASADGWFSLRDAAKALKMPERKFIAELQVRRWLYRDMKGRLRGYSDVTPRYINHRITPIPVDGEPDRVSMQPMVTTDGLTRLAGIFNIQEATA